MDLNSILNPVKGQATRAIDFIRQKYQQEMAIPEETRMANMQQRIGEYTQDPTAFSPIGGTTYAIKSARSKITPAIANALKRLSSEDRTMIGNFNTAVEKGMGRKELGELGKNIDNIRQGLNIDPGVSNQTLKKVFDRLLMFADRNAINPKY